MVATISTPADIINLALARIGYKQQIGSLWDGSNAARLALTLYGQTRDQLTREGDWEFARRDTVLTLLKSAPNDGYATVPWSTKYPALPWRYSYNYPDDCLKVMVVRSEPNFLPNYAPSYNNYSIDNDSSFTPSKRVILCNVPNAILGYVGQITDPKVWDPGFIEALSIALAERLAPALSGMQTANVETQEAKLEKQIAASEKG